MTDRHLIVVDTETTGLDTEIAAVLEIAAVNVTTGEEIRFVPYVHPDALRDADHEALAVNRYYERRVFADALDPTDTAVQYRRFGDFLQGNTFAGSNPSFDAEMLTGPLAKVGYAEPWHHRLADISAIAAGALGIDPTDLPGLARVCDLLGVENEDPHSAMGDARATAECFRRVAEIQKNGGPA